MKPLSLANRVALLVGLTAVILLGLAAAVMDHLIDGELQRRFDASLLVQARALAALIEKGPHGLEMEGGGRLVQHPLAPPLTQTFAARCPNTPVLTQGARAHSALALIQPVMRGSRALFTTIGTGKTRQRVVQVPFSLYDEEAVAAGAPTTTCTFVLMQPSASLDDILLETDAILIAVPMAVLVLVLVLSPWLVRRGLTPLSALREHMRDIGPQQAGRRLPASRVREIEPLVQRFNEVLERMDQGVLRERRFAGAVAHETRTHLAELRTLLDVELRHPSQRSMHQVLGEISDISAELEATVSALLLLTRLEAGIETVQISTVDVVGLLEAQLRHLEVQIEARKLSVEKAFAQAALRLKTDGELLKLIIANLVANAVAHAPEGERVTIVLAQDELRVCNKAPELEAADISHLGKRHWQKSSGADTHAGLGLSLAGAAAKVLDLGLTFELDEATDMLTARLQWSEMMHVSDAETARQQSDRQ